MYMVVTTNRNCKACKENENINVIKLLPFLCKPWYPSQSCSCEKLVTVNPYIFSYHFVANGIQLSSARLN